jgi:hypothetical protein
VRHAPGGTGFRHAIAAVSLLCLQSIAAPDEARAQGPRLDFQDARLVDVIRTIASLAGLNVVLADIPTADHVLGDSTDIASRPSADPRDSAGGQWPVLISRGVAQIPRWVRHSQ